MSNDIETKSFKTLLHESFKSDDTEEWLDKYFTRPIGLFFARIWYKLGVTPNTITILSIFLGVAAGVMFAFPDLIHNVLGIILLVFANFCDSTDGQLARLTNQKSMKGRCLDGFAGDVWFVAIYLAIIIRLFNVPMPGTELRWGIWIFVLCAVSGILCHSPQSSLADYYRQIHLLLLKGKEGSELDSYESEHTKAMAVKGKKGAFWDYQFHSNYQHYCKSQERRTPAFQRLRAMATEKFGTLEKLPEPLKKEFISGSRPLMKYTNILTFNSRAITIYITCLLGIPWLYPILEITVGECLYIYMHREHEKLCKHIIAEIEKL
ncbi:hypothetical protein PRLR6025_07690 [Prevotella lacticifex]|uniref:CDP-alcohol phosphatidyltransferase family protein n=1 Tax=Prevotella lacticifex TaxID=2854755 RepID=UPI001CC525D2|nr:CDP-alcohol phosphatidyltransferase family protein [Prevotella lacticifex]GJG67300.1 hypothetical protein PRLR6025_07690 [Prevotella lacticifex]